MLVSLIRILSKKFIVQLPIYLERGRKLFRQFRCIFPYFGIDTYLPREGTETLSRPLAVKPSTSIKFCLTLKGPETIFSYKSNPLLSITCIDTYLPREGTETNTSQSFGRQGKVQLSVYLARGRKLAFFKHSIQRQSAYRYLSTSRGAGNHHSTSSISNNGLLNTVQLPIYLKRGRKL